ncbi:hypothetical protein BDV10DRAFT_183133 [Aspergillus recurvatus]
MYPGGPPDTPFFCHTCQRTFINANALRMHCRFSKAHAPRVPVSATTPLPKPKSTPISLKSTVTSTPIKTVTIITSTSSSADPGPKPQCKRCDRVFRDEGALSNHERSRSHKNKDRGSHAALAAGSGSKDSELTNNSIEWKRGRRGNGKGSKSTTVSTEEAAGVGRAKPTSASALTSTSTATVRASSTTALAPSSHPGDDERISEAVPPTIVPPQSTVPAPVDIPDSLVQSKWKETWSGRWSFIPPAEREALLGLLKAKCHPEQSLVKEHYWTRPRKGTLTLPVLRAQAQYANSTQPKRTSRRKGILRGRGSGARKARCINCRQVGRNNGCITRPAHDFKLADDKLLKSKPSPAVSLNARQAVVLDCEMVGVRGPNNSEVSEVVRLAAVDFLSGEVLVDVFVDLGTKQRVISWRTRVSGVSKSLLDEMKKRGQTVQGWKAARDLLWRFVDEQTILIGHSLHHDLAVLRMAHARVVDSAILTRDAVAGGNKDCARLWALKTLSRTFLGLEIQTGKGGHDCLEDTFAAREVVLWCLGNPTKLGEWAAAEIAPWNLTGVRDRILGDQDVSHIGRIDPRVSSRYGAGFMSGNAMTSLGGLEHLKA